MKQHRLIALFIAAVCCVGIQSKSAAAIEPAHFHHVRLNVTDVDKSIAFYQRVFGTVPVKFRGGPDALFTERSFILFNVVDDPPDSTLNTGIWHIGWGGVDVKNEYEWWKSKGVDIHTPLSPLPGKDNYYFYINGPNKELIEINTMGHHRFGHVHLFATDVNVTSAWYRDNLGLKPARDFVPKPAGDMSTLATIWINTIRCDNVSIIIFGKPDRDPPPPWWHAPPLQKIQPTLGRPIDHIAFSYPEIEPVFQRLQQAGATIIKPIGYDDRLKMKSFFVLAPDDVLIEIVEAKAIPNDEP